MVGLMKRMVSLIFAWVICCPVGAIAQTVIRACGAVSVALPVSEASRILRSERNIELILGAVGGTATGLDTLGGKKSDIAFCSRSLTPLDRAAFPEVQFTEIPIGVQMVTMAVSRDVWDGGVHSISALQAKAIYEGRVRNWKELGGPDLAITVFMSAPGRGQWEIFVQWLYGGLRRAPVWGGTAVKEITETRNMLEFTRGSFALLPSAFVDNRKTFALAVREESGDLFEPTIANEKYPLSRPLLLVVNDKPTGAVKVIVDFMTGERGQELVKQTGYVTLAELKAAKGEK